MPKTFKKTCLIIDVTKLNSFTNSLSILEKEVTNAAAGCEIYRALSIFSDLTAKTKSYENLYLYREMCGKHAEANCF